ncbi:MAG: LCP family protein [Clostridia bacterium]|nr:LCP family protein [Clostridia bacterium]
MAVNRFNNSDSEFEDIFSNNSQSDEFEDVYSDSGANDEFEDVSSSSTGQAESFFTEQEAQSYQVKYNSAVENRRRQEIEYNDINDVYGELGDETKPKKKKKKRHPVRNAIIIILCISLCIGGFGYGKIDKLLSSFKGEEELSNNAYVNEADLAQIPDQINVLLIGIDARENEEASRSDTMMLVTLDKKNKQIKLTSFLRDSYVEIAGTNSWNKLNAAYFRGGVQTLSDTLELNFKVDIQYYAIVDFEIFQTIVDELGGIRVDVTERESYYTYHSGSVNVPVRIPAGEDVLLNGEQALWYSRIRYLDSDFKRTERQRKVIKAIVDKASTMSLTKLYSLAEAIVPLVKTNMSTNQILSLGITAFKNKMYKYPIVQHSIPADGTWYDKNVPGVGASLVMNMEENQALLHSFLQEPQEVPTENTTEN